MGLDLVEHCSGHVTDGIGHRSDFVGTLGMCASTWRSVFGVRAQPAWLLASETAPQDPQAR